jgi:hypothetical protein
MFQWLSNNREWVFSGVGVALAAFLIRVLLRKSSPTQTQCGGEESQNLQAGRDINIGGARRKEDPP